MKSSEQLKTEIEQVKGQLDASRLIIANIEADGVIKDDEVKGYAQEVTRVQLLVKRMDYLKDQLKKVEVFEAYQKHLDANDKYAALKAAHNELVLQMNEKYKKLFVDRQVYVGGYLTIEDIVSADKKVAASFDDFNSIGREANKCYMAARCLRDEHFPELKGTEKPGPLPEE
jgi:hypothetical protein